MSKLIFVSSPYTHKDKEVVNKRYEDVSKYAGKLVSEGKTTFSPITYGHVLCGFQEMPTDFEFWKNFCFDFLNKCDEFHVLMLDGWEESVGVKAEIEYAERLEIPIVYVEYE